MKSPITSAEALPTLRALLGEAVDGPAEDFLDLLPVGVYVCDRDGQVIDYNRAAAELWGRAPKLGDPAERFCGSHRLRSLDGRQIPHSGCPMAEVLATGEPVRDGEIVIEREDGSRVTALVSIAPIRNRDGEVIGAVNVFRDNSEQYSERSRLSEHSQKLDTILQAMPAAVYTTDAEGRITFYNEAAAALWGVRPELGSGQYCGSWKLYWPDGTPLPHDKCPMAMALKSKVAIQGMEAVCERPDGTRIPFLAYPTPLFDDTGALAGAVNVLLNTSQQQEIAARLRSSEARFRAIFDSAQVSVWEVDFSGVVDLLDDLRAAGVTDLRAHLKAQPDFLREATGRVRIVGVNRYTVELFEAPDEAALLEAVDSTHVRETNRILTEQLEALWEGHTRLESETTLRTLTGRRLQVVASIAFEGDRAERSVVCLHDITTRKASEEAAQRLAAIVEFSHDAIVAKDPDGTITSWNRGAENLYGYNAEEIIGRSVTMLIPADRVDEEAMILARVRSGRVVDHYETVRQRKDGSLFDVSLTVSPMKAADGTVIGASSIARDITERKAGNLAAQRLAAVVESSRDAILAMDLAGVITSWNRGAVQLYGHTAEEAIGQPVTLLIPDDRQDEEAIILERIRAGRQVDHYETVRRRKDGSLVDVSLAVSPIRASDGTIVGASKIARDITERRKAEEQQRLLLREMNHRIKNLLTLSSGLVSLSARYAKTPEELAAAVQQRLQALASAHEIILPKTDGDRDGEHTTTLQTLIHTILSPWLHPSREASPRVGISGCDTELSSRCATSFALLLHEFATNAAKYGALSNVEGRVAVDCSDEGDRFVIVWRECGGPPCSGEENGTGFGEVLTRATVKGQLRGELTREWGPDGLVIRLSTPKDRLLA